MDETKRFIVIAAATCCSLDMVTSCTNKKEMKSYTKTREVQSATERYPDVNRQKKSPTQDASQQDVNNRTKEN